MSFTERVSHLRPEGAYQVLAKANELERAGRVIIHLEIGQPDYPTFENVSKAGIEAIRTGRTRYTPPSGVPTLREVLADDAGKRRGINISPDEVVVGPGGKPVLYFPTMAIIEPGDEVICPDPGFPTYEAMIRVAGGIPIPVPLLEDNQFSFNINLFDRLINKKTKLIILNSPSNPTGGVIPQTDLEYIAKKAIEFDCWVMSDELYTRIVYDGLTASSIASLPGMKERTIIVDGFSKTYSMTGWRLGFGIMPTALAAKVDLLLTHAVGSTAHFTQFAGIEAINGPQDKVDEMVNEYQRRRNVIVDGLNTIPGFRCQKPQGAFYVFPNITATGLTSTECADLILEKAGVALLPGNSFGFHGEGYLRLSYANSLENIEQAIEKIKLCF